MSYKHLARDVSGTILHGIDDIRGDRDQLRVRWTDPEGYPHSFELPLQAVGAIETWFKQEPITPEERAQAVFDRWEKGPQPPRQIVVWIADAIRAAIDADRTTRNQP